MKLPKPTYKQVQTATDFMENIVLSLTDATLPENKLKRKAKRTCLQCQGTYTSDVSLLCDDGFCSEPCKAQWEAIVHAYDSSKLSEK